MEIYYIIATKVKLPEICEHGSVRANSEYEAYKIIRQMFPLYCYGHKYRMYIFDNYPGYAFYIHNYNLKWMSGNSVVDL